MFIPYGPDAPLYHRPWVTGVLVITNVVVFLSGASFDLALENQRVVPIAWVTAHFGHVGIVHLLVNMMFVWTFGQIIEGKLGWWRFLLVYLGIGVVMAVLQQAIAIAIGEQGGFLGASAIIYGLMAMAWVWAPENEVEVCCFVYMYSAPRLFTLSNRTLTIIYLALDVLFATLAFLAGAGITSSFLHVLGAAVGFPLAVVLLRYEVVDCEGWDMFSLRNGKPRTSRVQYSADALSPAERDARFQDERDTALTLIEEYLSTGEPKLAEEAYRSVARRVAWDLPESVLLQLTRAHLARGSFRDAGHHASRCIRRFPEHANTLHLETAKALLEAGRPASALDLLESVIPSTREEFETRERLTTRAKELIDMGSLELDVEESSA